MKVEQAPFFSHSFNNNRKPVLQLKKFRSARRKKDNSKSENIHKIPVTINIFQELNFLTVKGNVFFLESTEPLGVRNVQVSLAKKFYCLNLTSTTSQTLYKTREKSDKEKMSSAKTAQFRQQLGEKNEYCGFFFFVEQIETFSAEEQVHGCC